MFFVCLGLCVLYYVEFGDVFCVLLFDGGVLWYEDGIVGVNG